MCGACIGVLVSAGYKHRYFIQEGIFICYPVFWLPDGHVFDCQLRQDSEKIKVSELVYECIPKIFIVFNSFTMEADSCAKYKVAPSPYRAKHSCLYLIVVVVSPFQLCHSIANGKTITLLCCYCLVYCHLFVAAGILKFYQPF